MTSLTDPFTAEYESLVCMFIVYLSSDGKLLNLSSQARIHICLSLFILKLCLHQHTDVKVHWDIIVIKKHLGEEGI